VTLNLCGCTLVGRKISYERSAAPRNDAVPVLRIPLEGIVLERIDLTANKIVILIYVLPWVEVDTGHST